MGLFSRKKQPEQLEQLVADERTRLSEVTALPEEYRQQLQQAGLDYLKEVIDSQVGDLGADLDELAGQLVSEMKQYTSRQLDITIARVSSEITSQLNERISQYNRTADQAQELVVESLSQNAQLVYEKYQQMATNLQQIIASQEVMMVSVFQDNKTSAAAASQKQHQLMESLTKEAEQSISQSVESRRHLKQTTDDQARKLLEVYQENITRMDHIRQAQDLAIDKLNQSVERLSQQQQQLGQMLDQSIAQQKTEMAELINQNLARIVEHYLLSALGEDTDISRQLPEILKRLEQAKPGMVEDMRL